MLKQVGVDRTRTMHIEPIRTVHFVHRPFLTSSGEMAVLDIDIEERRRHYFYKPCNELFATNLALLIGNSYKFRIIYLFVKLK